MSTPVMKVPEPAFDIETLIYKLTLLKFTMDKDSESSSTSEYSGSVSSTSSASTAFTDIDFNDRCPEVKQARLASSILSLDEDIPEYIDQSIKKLLMQYNNTTAALERLDFMVSQEEYLEYKQQMAAQRAREKKLPRSNGRPPASK